MRLVWFGLVVAACSTGSGDERPAAPAGTAGSKSRSPDDKTNSAGETATHEAGAAGSGAADGSGAEGGATPGAGGALAGGTPSAEAGAGIVFEVAGAPAQSPPGVCDPEMNLDGEQTLVLGDLEAALLSLTGDELSIAFTTDDESGLVLHVADRSSAQGEFAEVSVTVPEGYEAASGVALSGDGRTLVLVSDDQARLAALSRDERGHAFDGGAETAAFEKINLLEPITGKSVGWPVLSNDGSALYYLSYSDSSFVVRSELGQDGVYDFGTRIDEFTLGGTEGAHKLPSALSADERAIFFFDQGTERAGALFRARPLGPFYDPIELGPSRAVAPNLDCSRLYSSVGGVVVVQQVE